MCKSVDEAGDGDAVVVVVFHSFAQRVLDPSVGLVFADTFERAVVVALCADIDSMAFDVER